MTRKEKQRRLNAAGISHASGWIETTDLPAFAEMVARAESKVADVLGDATTVTGAGKH